MYNEIILNNLRPGTPIVETEVAKFLNISRTPVREALKELEADGLVTSYNSRGTFVSYISPYDVEEIFSLRITLELLALNLSMDFITDEDLDLLEKKFTELLNDFSWEKNHETDTELHSLIINKSGNKRLKIFIDTLNGQIERFRRIASKDAVRASKSVSEHMEIIDHIRKRDLKACEESLIKHLEGVKKSVLQISRADSI